MRDNVGVVLPTWQGIKHIPQCINGYLTQTLKPHIIVIVEQGSTDGSKELVRKFVDANPNLPLKLIDLKENIGYSKGCNLGLKYVMNLKVDYILYSNNDIVPFRDMVETMVEGLKKHEEAGAVALPSYSVKTKERIPGIGGWIRRNDDYLKIDGFGKYWTDSYIKACPKCNFNLGSPLKIKQKTEDFTIKCSNCGCEPYKEEAIICDYVGGGCFMVPRHIVEKIGGFEEKYTPMYEEDVSMCCRIRELGYKIMYINSSGFYHDVSACAKTDPDKWWKIHIDNKKKFVEQWAKKINMGVV